MQESNDHPFTYIHVKKIVFDIFKYKKFVYSDLERTQDWPKAFVVSAALKITKSSFF